MLPCAFAGRGRGETSGSRPSCMPAPAPVRPGAPDVAGLHAERRTPASRGRWLRAGEADRKGEGYDVSAVQRRRDGSRARAAGIPGRARKDALGQPRHASGEPACGACHQGMPVLAQRVGHAQHQPGLLGRQPRAGHRDGRRGALRAGPCRREGRVRRRVGLRRGHQRIDGEARLPAARSGGGLGRQDRVPPSRRMGLGGPGATQQGLPVGRAVRPEVHHLHRVLRAARFVHGLRERGRRARRRGRAGARPRPVLPAVRPVPRLRRPLQGAFRRGRHRAARRLGLADRAAAFGGHHPGHDPSLREARRVARAREGHVPGAALLREDRVPGPAHGGGGCGPVDGAGRQRQEVRRGCVRRSAHGGSGGSRTGGGRHRRRGVARGGTVRGGLRRSRQARGPVHLFGATW